VAGCDKEVAEWRKNCKSVVELGKEVEKLLKTASDKESKQQQKQPQAMLMRSNRFEKPKKTIGLLDNNDETHGDNDEVGEVSNSRKGYHRVPSSWERSSSVRPAVESYERYSSVDGGRRMTEEDWQPLDEYLNELKATERRRKKARRRTRVRKTTISVIGFVRDDQPKIYRVAKMSRDKRIL
jgi:hypothetical protein